MSEPVVVHLVDGTYELFRHFYGARRFNDGKDAPRDGRCIKDHWF